MMLTLTFALFLLVVLGSFIITCMPAPVTTESGRADQRGVHAEAFIFVIDDTAIRESAADSAQAFPAPSTGDPDAGRALLLSNSPGEPLKEAA